MPTNRLVALLTPVFSAVAAIATAWIRKHCPGLPVPSTGELTGLELAGAAAAGASALKWLHGHQKWEARVEDAEHWAAQFDKGVQGVAPGVTTDVHAYASAELEDLVAQGVAAVAATPDGKDGPQVALATQASEAAAQAPAAPIAGPVQGGAI